jgi:hypothetical protein
MMLLGNDIEVSSLTKRSADVIGSESLDRS